MEFTCRSCGVVLRTQTHDKQEDQAALEALVWNRQGNRCKDCSEKNKSITGPK
jgi:formamidopyrimidine-DNA glycosylase